MTTYIERMIAPDRMLRCDTCGTFIRWPEDIRVYAESNGKPAYVEHLRHPIRDEAQRIG